MRFAFLMALFVPVSTAIAGETVDRLTPNAPFENQQLPPVVKDLIDSTRTVLSSGLAPLGQADPRTQSGDRTVTITGSNITFTSDSPVIIQLIRSMLENSEPGATADKELSRAMAAVLDVEPNDQVMERAIEATLVCRQLEMLLLRCIEALVNAASEREKPQPSVGDWD